MWGEEIYPETICRGTAQYSLEDRNPANNHTVVHNVPEPVS